MITKKVCMVGAFAVGKTALVQRFVHSLFSDSYLSTVGVKISKKTIELNDAQVNMVLWDLEGRDDYGDINLSYLRGAMGLILVADGNREETLMAALALRKMALESIGPVPHILFINKCDLKPQWEISDETIAALRQEEGLDIFLTSAKTGESVEEAFATLTRQMLR